MRSLEPKDASEAYAIEFKFDRVLTAVTGAVVTVSVLSGTDATPGDLLDGAAQSSGSSVYQRVKSGKTGCTYKLKCVATGTTPGGPETYALTASLGVVEA